MSYLALARKWRPAQFSQVVGQSHVLTALENALNQNKLHHAYLFSGTRGVGKTSIGRLFAKGLNCETGITATPCGECDACKEIDEGRFVDLLEIDAASRTKVEDTRELLDNVQYKPARGRFKVYLIDEVHMLSRHSFNALLKTLEEPPEYVKFLLATTDPQKLPVTILSRCLQFHLKPISVDVIHTQLDSILHKESVATEHRALGLIAHAADGSMRDALSLADQAIALGNGVVSADTVSTMLGSIDTDQAIQLLDAMAGKQVQHAMQTVQLLAENGIDWDSLLQQLATQLHRIAMFQALPSSLDPSKPDAEKLKLVSQRLTPQDVQLYYQIALKGRQDMPLAPTARTGLEMTVLRMMAFRPTKANIATAIELPSEQPVQANSMQSSHAQPDHLQPSAPVTVTIENTSGTPQSSPVLSESEQGASAIQTGSVTPSSGEFQTEQPPMPLEQDYPPVNDEFSSAEYVPQEVHSTQMGISHIPETSSTPVRSKAVTDASEQQVTKPAVVGLRHQLRSKRTNGVVSKPSTENRGKKPKAALASSAIERVTQQHNVTKPVPPESFEHVDENNTIDNSKPYQWKSSVSKPNTDEEKSELTPTQIKQALGHTKTPEMTEKLVNESVRRDEWTALIQKLQVSKLVEQLALNSSYEKYGSTIVLNVRTTHAHLNQDKAQSELLSALNVVLGEHCNLTVEESSKGQTPLELREAIYQHKLQEAHQILESDKNVQFIQTRFSAEIDVESVRPI